MLWERFARISCAAYVGIVLLMCVVVMSPLMIYWWSYDVIDEGIGTPTDPA